MTTTPETTPAASPPDTTPDDYDRRFTAAFVAVRNYWRARLHGPRFARMALDDLALIRREWLTGNFSLAAMWKWGRLSVSMYTKTVIKERNRIQKLHAISPRGVVARDADRAAADAALLADVHALDQKYPRHSRRWVASRLLARGTYVDVSEDTLMKRMDRAKRRAVAKGRATPQPPPSKKM
jgi:hypothetical protein